jgi:hypothetical protein
MISPLIGDRTLDTQVYVTNEQRLSFLPCFRVFFLSLGHSSSIIHVSFPIVPTVIYHFL